MESRSIVLWGTEPRVGCKTLARSLAQQWADQNGRVLVVAVTPLEKSDTWGWVDRFKPLSPALLRNYLKGPHEAYARLELNALPPATVSSELIPLLKKAFDWILWVFPVAWGPESLALLDQADLLLWVARPSELSAKNMKRHFEQLAALHYANAFSQVVLNQIPFDSFQPDESLAVCEGKPVLAGLPQELPRGTMYQQGVRRLLQTLQTRKDLYRINTPVEQVTNTTVESIKNRIQPQLIEVLGTTQQADVAAQQTLNTCLAEDTNLPASRAQRDAIFTRVMEDVLGLGPLEPLLKDPEVTEVMVNGRDRVFVEKRGQLHPTGVHFSSEAQLRTMIDRIVAPLGRRVDESMPLCDARLPDGSRVNIVLPPLALGGPFVTIRKFAGRAPTLADLVQWQSLSAEMAEFLRRAILARKNIVVAGGTGSGKTTLLNALSGLIPDNERIATIEDAAELRLQKPHVVRLESRPPNAEGEGAIPIRRLVMNALRMRPDRIVVGECRGGEALDMLQAMNTGHDGSLTTLHANTPRDALRRLETLVLMAGIELPVRVVREQIQSAVDLLIQQARMADGSRRIISITEVTGMEEDVLTIQELYRFHQGAFEKTAMASMFSQAAG